MIAKCCTDRPAQTPVLDSPARVFVFLLYILKWSQQRMGAELGWTVWIVGVPVPSALDAFLSLAALLADSLKWNLPVAKITKMLALAPKSSRLVPNKNVFSQIGLKNVKRRSASRLAEPPLSLLMPYGLMPRTWASPRPSCPMVQLIICSATRKLMLAYASSCSVTTGCQGHNCSGCLTDWFGIRGLGLD